MNATIDFHTLAVPHEQAAAGQETIRNIQALRGIASLIVFLGHALLLQPGLGLDGYFSFFGVFASSGVDIFFVISGFIITTVAMKAGDQNATAPQIAWNFGVNRFSRIYPVYWIAFALAVMASSKVQLSPPTLHVDPLWQQGMLLTHENSYIMAAWSLCFEIYFYLVATLSLIISPKHVGKVLAGWATTIAMIVAYDIFIGKNQWVATVPLSPLNFEFIFGMIVAYLIRRGCTAFAMTSGLFGLTTFLAGAEYMRHLGWWTLIPWYRVFCSGIPSAFILYAIIAVEYRRIWTFSSRWISLGDSSYSLYIWHQLIFYSVLSFATHMGWVDRVPSFILISMWVVPAFLFGIFSYWRLEMPLQAILKHRLLIKQ